MRNVKKLLLMQFACLWLISAYAQSTFTDVSQTSGLLHIGYNRIQMGGGSAWFDYDQDGDEDLMTVGGLGDNILWRNEGNGTFSDQTQSAGLNVFYGYDTQGIVTGDIDNDGFREIFISTVWHQRNFLFKNNGNGTFSDISLSSGIGLDSMWVSSAAFGDFDQDGLLDLYRGNYVWLGRALQDSLGNYVGYAHRCNANTLHRNNGDGTFTEVSSQFLVGDTGCALAVVFTDYDSDHDQDILFANDFGAWVAPSGLLQSQYPNAYSDVSVGTNMNAQMYGMGIAVGDYDHDLDLDYYVTNIGPNALFQQQANHTFIDQASSSGVLNDSVGPGLAIGWGDAWIDFDNDMWQDLFVANGYIQLIPLFVPAPQDPDKLYRNLGNGSFSDVGMALGLGDTNAGRGMSMADFDQDGDLDLFVNVVNFDSNGTEISHLYRNDVNSGNHWLQVQAQGTYSNRDAFGTQMIIRIGNEKWIHEINGGSSHMSQNSSIAHFGAGSATIIDSLWIIWPTGNVQLQTAIPADQRILIIEDSTAFLSLEKPEISDFSLYPNPFASIIQFEFSVNYGSVYQIAISDLRGQIIRQFSSQAVAEGKQKWIWDGKTESGHIASDGLYLFQLKTEKSILTRRILKL